MERRPCGLKLEAEYQSVRQQSWLLCLRPIGHVQVSTQQTCIAFLPTRVQGPTWLQDGCSGLLRKSPVKIRHGPLRTLAKPTVCDLHILGFEAEISYSAVPSDFSRFLVLPKGTAPQQPISAPTQVVDKAAALQSASDTFKANIVNITQVYGRSIDLSGSGLSQADIPEAQLQLFKEGFNLGFDDAVQFSTGTGANQSVHRPCKIGHIDRWSDLRTENFLDSAVPALGDSVPWQRLLNFLKSSGTLDAPSVKVWEYKEGVIAGIAALDSGMPDSFHLWADEVKKA